jgi:hypothetical protein
MRQAEKEVGRLLMGLDWFDILYIKESSKGLRWMLENCENIIGSALGKEERINTNDKVSFTPNNVLVVILIVIYMLYVLFVCGKSLPIFPVGSMLSYLILSV